MQRENHFRTIKEARDELREWAKYQVRTAHFQIGNVGSTMYKFMQSQRVHGAGRVRKRSKNPDHQNRLSGVERQLGAHASEKRQSSHSIKEPSVPAHVEELSRFIATLPEQCIKALRDKYILQLTVMDQWIARAENEVMKRRTG